MTAMTADSLSRRERERESAERPSSRVVVVREKEEKNRRAWLVPNPFEPTSRAVSEAPLTPELTPEASLCLL